MAVELCPFSEAAPRIVNADVLLFRGHGAFSDAIRASGRSLHSHAGLAAVVPFVDLPPWIGCVETVEGYGGRVIGLAQYVRQYKGWIDVYRVTEPLFRRDTAICWAWQHTINRPYGGRRLVKVALQYVPLLRWFVRPSHDDLLPLVDNPFCSAAVSAALRAGGWDPVKNLADQDTTPGDLERADLKYLFTLTPNEEAMARNAGN